MDSWRSEPGWYGIRYPSRDDLLAFAHELGALVGYAALDGEALYFAPEGEEPAVILLPSDAGPLQLMWVLAHELGHLVHHAGPHGEAVWSKGERQANRWAACALIPAERIATHGNASLDAFIGALSAHYEDLPLRDCRQRRLAGRIARIRITALEEAAA